MDRYAIYTYHFDDAPVEGNWTEGAEVTRPDSSFKQRLKWFEALFGKKNNTFTMKKENKHDADYYPCTVMAHPENIVLLRLERPKHEKVWEKQESTTGEAARIDERNIPSFPYIYIMSLTCPLTQVFCYVTHQSPVIKRLLFVFKNIVNFSRNC